MLWIVGLLALAIGTALGALMTKANQKDTDETGSDNDKIKELQEQLAQAQQASNEYQDKVSEHFVKTSELFGEMTENYRTAYQHLASGAQSLCKPGTEAALLTTSLIEQLSANESTQQADDIQDKAEEILATRQVESEDVIAANSTPLSELTTDNAAVEPKNTENFSEVEISAKSDKAVNEELEPVQVQAADEKVEAAAASKTINEQPLPDALHVKVSDDRSRPSIH